jgi:hypothetical protein
MSLVSIEDARARGIPLPADDDAAQGVIDGVEAWLARRIGQLTGERTETFYVGTYLSSSEGKLGLARYTDAVELTDGALVAGAAVPTASFRLVDRGASVTRTAYATTGYWSGPYVTATYEPNDETLVVEAVYSLLRIKVSETVVTGLKSETIGAYSYEVGGGAASPAAARAAIVSGILPIRDQLTTLVAASRNLRLGDPVINRAEADW